MENIENIDIDFKEMILVEFDILAPIIYNAYFKAEISTKKAAKILNKSVPEFVDWINEWTEDGR